MTRLCARVVGEDDVDWLRECEDRKTERDDEVVWCD